MGDVVNSVLARLKNKSKESGRSYQLCLQLFCQEEFLRRLEKSKYDIYYLLHNFDFEGKVLYEALSKTFTNREHIFTIEQFKQIMTFDRDDGMQKKWKAFTKKIDVEMEEFSMILRSINVFLWEPYIAVIEGSIFQKQWDSKEGRWETVEK